MISWLLPISCVVLALLLLFAALRLMGKFQWLLAWARGMAGLLLLVAAVTVAVFGYDLLSYREGAYDQLVANLSFEQTGIQSYEAVLVNTRGDESRYQLSGDQWQLDARILKWSNGIPAKPLYRMDRLSGRYLSLENERDLPQTVYNVGPDSGYIDAWDAVRRYRLLFPFINALYGSASYLPMVDGAIYSISLGQHGLIGRPLNEAASVALASWY
jgi:hypothetical protein